ncbi:pyrimidine pathway regulatory 1 [Fusarium beomiforme]|uniref:Pyrimidine pathway regulatory 1 n=1 Tax=Fusarium beomiforme TaxID=44412 RepID=A0A9P5A7B1_9HYPO|nr:pyrimidine pathway regulatory 1 [Fusarium beomiforme]
MHTQDLSLETDQHFLASVEPSTRGVRAVRKPTFPASLLTHQHQDRILETTASLATQNIPQTSRQAARRRSPASLDVGRFVGQDEGVSFLLSTLHTASQQLQQGSSFRPSDNIQTPATCIEYHSPHPFPPYQIAMQALDQYFRVFHVAHPLLQRESLQTCLDKAPEWTNQEKTNLTPQERHDIFQFYMAIAIGSIRLFRDKTFDQHPFGFFTAALEMNPPAESRYDTLGNIENLILIARFGVYYNIGCSLWELSRLRIRSCIELDLHRRHPKSCGSNAELLGQSQRVFWEAYLLDRFSSRTLGRPFAIADRLIFANVPHPNPDSQIHDFSVFSWLVGIGRLSSQIHSTMEEQRPSPTSATMAPDLGEILCQLRYFHHELSNWHKAAPSFDSPVCIFETREFFELTYQDERLRLIRATIEVLGSKTMLPPDVLLQPCLQAARAIICFFAALRARNLITFSRAYMHLIFTASLVIVVDLEMRIRRQDGHRHRRSYKLDAEDWLRDLFDDRWDPKPKDVWNDLAVAGSLLSWLADSMPDMVVYSQFFHTLQHQLEAARASFGESGTNLEVSDSSVETLGSSHNSPPCHSATADIGLGLEQGNHLEMGIMGDFPTIQLDNAQVGTLDEDGMPTGWPLAYVLGVEGISAGLSEFVWDTVVPWDESPARSSDV